MIDATPYLPAHQQEAGQAWTAAIRLILGAGNGCDSGEEMSERQGKVVKGRFLSQLAAAPKPVQAVAIALLEGME